MEEKNTAGKAERPYFTFFRSFYKAIDNLPEQVQLSLYRAIVAYSLDFQEPDFFAAGKRRLYPGNLGGLSPYLAEWNKALP